MKALAVVVLAPDWMVQMLYSGFQRSRHAPRSRGALLPVS
jgi:hypothetical protein